MGQLLKVLANRAINVVVVYCFYKQLPISFPDLSKDQLGFCLFVFLMLYFRPGTDE